MKSDSSELLYILLFVAIVLFQYLLPWLRRKRDGVEDGELPDTEPGTEGVAPEMQPPEPIPPPVADEPPLPPLPAAAGDRRRNATGPGRPFDRTPKRHSRQALFGSKPRIQDAMVAAVILGPCRALSPHDEGK